MIRLSRFADYGIVLMGRMAVMPGELHNAVDLAEAAGVPAPTVSKVLARLARYGLLSSVRGSRGGFRLARPVSDISVEDIIAAVDGPIALTLCMEGGDNTCTIQSLCPSQQNLQLINDAIRTALRSVTLEDLAFRGVNFDPPADSGRAASAG